VTENIKMSNLHPSIKNFLQPSSVQLDHPKWTLGALIDYAYNYKKW
jgi:hypothetical protein